MRRDHAARFVVKSEHFYLYGRASPVVMVDPNGTFDVPAVLKEAAEPYVAAGKAAYKELQLRTTDKLSDVAPEDREAWSALRTHGPAEDLQLPDSEDANRTFQPSNAVQWEIPEALKLPYAEVQRIAVESSGLESLVAYALHAHTGALASVGEILDLPNDALTSYESLASGDPDPEGKGAWSFAKVVTAAYGGARLLGPKPAQTERRRPGEERR